MALQLACVVDGVTYPNAYHVCRGNLMIDYGHTRITVPLFIYANKAAADNDPDGADPLYNNAMTIVDGLPLAGSPTPENPAVPLFTEYFSGAVEGDLMSIFYNFLLAEDMTQYAGNPGSDTYPDFRNATLVP